METGKIFQFILKKHKIDKTETEFTFTVDQKPQKVGIDPYNKLIDRKPDDNTKRLTKAKTE